MMNVLLRLVLTPFLSSPTGVLLFSLEVVPLVGHVGCVKEAWGHRLTLLQRLGLARGGFCNRVVGGVHINDEDMLNAILL